MYNVELGCRSVAASPQFSIFNLNSTVENSRMHGDHSDGIYKPMGWSPQAPHELRRVRTRNFAGCEVGTSQGAKLGYRRVRNVGAALGDSSSRCRVGTNVGRAPYI